MSQPIPTLYALGTSYPPTPLHQFDPPLPPPMRSMPEKYPVVFDRGDGSVAGHGFRNTLWPFQILTQGELDVLLNILTVSSVLQKSRSGIYITTRTPEDHDTYATYTAIMILPQGLTDRRQVHGLYTDVVFEFRKLVPYSP